MRKYTFSAIFFILVFISSLSAATLNQNQPQLFSLQKADETIEFDFLYPKNRLMAISVNFADKSSASASIMISGETRVSAAQAAWNGAFDRQVFAHDGPTTIVDNISPLPGAWKIKITGAECPVSGHLKLIDQGEIPDVVYSEKTGAIQIKKPGNQNIIAVGDVEHPDFAGADKEFSGTITAEGDVMIPLPAGFYRLQHPAETISTIQAHLIPVHPGKITIVENWPTAPASEATRNDEEATGTATPSSILHKEMRLRSARLLDNDQVKVRFATPQWQGKITKEDLEISESGIKAEIVSAGTVATPLSLTILLDSSGSMKKDMKLALASVEQFIRLLPDDSDIRLIDFDTRAREISAKDRAGLLKALKAIKADGATCLNDSVMMGLATSEGRSRPAVLLFTDGFDANHNDTGPGSKTKPEEMFEAVKNAEIPVFTIGFGAKPDDATLKRLATLSGGFYHKADKDNISRVFAQVASILGREHEMVYRRPGIRGNSDAPVISIVLDVSGSMDMPPGEEGCDYRLEKAKAILRDLIRRLPEDAIAQITTYSLYQNIVQVFTGDKQQLLASLAPIKAGGGTATLETLQLAFKMLKEVPTDRKYLLFITDAGLDIESSPVEYEAVLGSIKDAGIKTTWIGMVNNSDKAPFDRAATMCNGQAFVSTDFEAVRSAVESFGKSIQTASGPADLRLPIQLGFTRREEMGRMLLMTAGDKFELPAPPVTSKAAVNGLKISFADLPPSLQRYSLDLSQSLYGGSKTRDETIITSRLPINASAMNKAVKLTVVEMLLLSRFRGISLPCAALKLRIENILPEHETTAVSESETHPAGVISQAAKSAKTVRGAPPYLIPSVRTHFFATLNDLAAAPVSDLSWLAEDPLVFPDDESLQINHGEPIEGYLIFECDTPSSINKASLSYFDTVYGHICLPIIGTINAASHAISISQLPESPSGNISEAFKLSLKGLSDTVLPEPFNNLTLRTYELQITSQVQALLDLNPAERLSMMLPTRFGNLVLSPSPRTTLIPQGWYRPVMFLPGSNNFLRQAYLMPRSLAETSKGTLRVDVADNELLLAADNKLLKRDKPVLSAGGDKIRLDINAYSIKDGIALFDITLNDEKDGSGTLIPAGDIIQIQISENIFRSEGAADEYMFQAPKQLEIADGHSRRVIFKINYDADHDEGAKLLIKSDIFKVEYTAKKQAEGKIDDYMLCSADLFAVDNSRQIEIAALTEKVHAERVASGWKKKGSCATKRQTLKNQSASSDKPSPEGEAEGVVLPVPDFKGAMSKNIQHLLKMNEDEFLAWMRQLACIPADVNLRNSAYAPEAVLMQNWGTPADLLELARIYYKATGALLDETNRVAVLSDTGKTALSKLTGWNSEIEQLPVLSTGNKRLVIPFFKDVTELQNEVSEILEEEAGQMIERGLTLTIKLKVKPKAAGQAAMIGGIGSALGGEEGEEESGLVTLFESSLLNFADCSRAPIDIFYFSPDQGQNLYVSSEWAAGKLENQANPISLAENEVIEEIIEIRADEEILTFRRPLASGSSILDTFRSIALCMPDITASASEAMSRQFASLKTEEAPGTRSSIRWFTRAKIFQFLALQSAAEAEAAAITGVKTARPAQRMRAIIMTVTSGKDGLRALFDLRQINPLVQGEEKAIRAFNFFMGITNTMLEEMVMGGGGLLSRWKAARDPKLVIAGPEDINRLIEGLNEEFVSEEIVTMLQKAEEEGKGVIIALNSPCRDGKAMPAWFTFDPATYEMNSVLDNGAYGSLVERPISEIIQDAAKYALGFWVGVNSSVWAVCAYTLKYDDLRKVIKAAKKLCLGIAAQLENIGKPLTDFIPDSFTAGEAGISAGPASLKMGFGEFTPTSFKLMTKPSLDFNFSYQSGFEDAVKAYFGD